ncbi:MAG: Xaa-Pro peptidase family protein [Chloroflexi bacterium]|nr:Xaa-Pro peptidase family protein [Chloroflexota bacterium]
MTRSTANNEELARARLALATAGADVALLSSLANVTYASGWEAPVPLGALADLSYGQPLLICAVKSPEAVLVAPDAYRAEAAAQAAVDEVIAFETFDSFRPTHSRQSYLDAVAEALRRVGATGGRGTLAVEERALPLVVERLLVQTLPGWRRIDAEEPLQRARMVKTEREIHLLREASALADVAHRCLGELCQEAGRTEFSMWAEIEARVFAAAGGAIPLTGELVTGPRTTTVAYPNGPLDRTTAPGDPALMDLSGRTQGYWFDCTNTHVIAATPTPEQRRYARASQAACESAMNALRPGALAADAAAAAEAAFAGFGLPMAHYAGHQIGVSVNELPRLVPYDQTPIEAGMVFSVEPGAYQGPGQSFGARSEKMVLVTPDGPEVLSTFVWGI